MQSVTYAADLAALRYECKLFLRVLGIFDGESAVYASFAILAGITNMIIDHLPEVDI